MIDDKRTPDSISDLEKSKLDTILTFGLQIVWLIDAVQELQRKIQKLDEVYYHVFPDRFDKDSKFEQQLSKLSSPSEPGATDKA